VNELDTFTAMLDRAIIHYTVERGDWFTLVRIDYRVSVFCFETDTGALVSVDE